jgi:hypothetical protein
MNSTQGFPDSRTRNQVAKQADVSDHTARQAIAVAQHAPDLVPAVLSGEVKLRDPAKQARDDSPKSHASAAAGLEYGSAM